MQKEKGSYVDMYLSYVNMQTFANSHPYSHDDTNITEFYKEFFEHTLLEQLTQTITLQLIKQLIKLKKSLSREI